MPRTNAQEQRRLDLRQKRAEDIFELVAEQPKTTPELLGEAVPPLDDEDEGLQMLSARELGWFLQIGAKVDAAVGRAAGTTDSDLAITAQYTYDKLTVTYKPRYFLRSGTTIMLAKIYTYYQASLGLELPEVKPHSHTVT